jgi:hypothetical protein
MTVCKTTFRRYVGPYDALEHAHVDQDNDAAPQNGEGDGNRPASERTQICARPADGFADDGAPNANAGEGGSKVAPGPSDNVFFKLKEILDRFSGCRK